MPPDSSTACRPIGLDRRQLGLAREEGQIVILESIIKRVVTLEEKEEEKNCNNGLAVVSKN